ncbi:hypothetical protein EDC01DRAFT_680112 [Geopyxis carbonaria]|nr:hypothetical protein EDC01DRAFT_680112 [Geopyxis carbonaria]
MVTLISMAIHVPINKVEIKVYIAAAGALWGFGLVTRFFTTCYRSVGSTAEVIGLEGRSATRICVTLAKPWKLGPGQYVYLRIPSVSSGSIFQSHPFALAWWDVDSHGRSRGSRAYFLVEPRNGFTKKLLDCRGNQTQAIIEGPYGQARDLGLYGTVLMVASGMGIIGQLPYIRKLVEGHGQRIVRTKSIHLIWAMGEAEHSRWIDPWMQELTQRDREYVLDISMYIPGEGPPSKNNAGKTDCIRKFYGVVPDIPRLLEEYIAKTPGKVIVTVCADHTINSSVRRTVERQSMKSVRYEEVGFYPRPVEIKNFKGAKEEFGEV